MIEYIGYLMLVAPLVGIFIHVALEDGLRTSVCITAFVVMLLLWIGLGVHLSGVGS